MFYDVYERLCMEHNELPFVLPQKLGIAKSNSIVAQWQKGSTPRLQTLRVLADYFNVPVSYLMDLEQEKSPHPKAEETDPEMQELLNLVKDMTPKEIALLTDRAKKIKESRI